MLEETKYEITGGQLENNVKRFFSLQNINELENYYKSKFTKSMYKTMKENTFEIYNDANKMNIVKDKLLGIKCNYNFCIFFLYLLLPTNPYYRIVLVYVPSLI